MSTAMALLGDAAPSGVALSAPARRSLRLGIERSVVAAVIARSEERERAALTSEVLVDTSSLSSLQDALVQIAPGGATRYESVLDAYVAGATAAIRRL